jgi:tRNA A22 N-methylase
MEFEKDENVILDEGFWGSNKKLLLTNKRLLVQKRQGTVISMWEIEHEILLEEIEEAYRMIDVFTSLSSLILKLKNKEQLLFNFKLIDSQMAGLGRDIGTNISTRTKEITNKYLTGINNQIHKKISEIFHLGEWLFVPLKMMSPLVFLQNSPFLKVLKSSTFVIV